MATLATLPDLLILVFAHPAVTIPDLLACEKVCKQWGTLIRNNSVQIWKLKIVKGFPDGCLPVLYGSENWRNVAALWWAWRRPMVRRPKGAADLRDSTGLRRRSDGVVRDLATMTGGVQKYEVAAQAIRPEGRLIIESLLGWYFSEPPFVDTVFADIPARQIEDIFSGIRYVRTTHVLRHIEPCDIHYGWGTVEEGKECSVVIEDWEFDTNDMSIPIGDACSTWVIGSNVLQFETSQQDALFTIRSIRDLSLRFEGRRSAPSKMRIAFAAANETVIAYITQHHGGPLTLCVSRLSDQKLIASYILTVVDCTKLWITRFNVFLVAKLVHSFQSLMVFDFELNLLSTHRQSPKHVMVEPNDWCIYWRTPHHAKPEEEEVVVLDAKKRTWAYIPSP
ncbi:hypothetical protein HDV00_003072 [Rhizophlyctis rosea]|nr:hypothetical protein HDV00_003072 [Rhizophlyctis rosea]